MYRSSPALWLTAIGALVGFLLADGRPPTEWSYQDWLKFLAAIVAWGVGKLQSSPLPGKDDY
jgi:hypothetical protein